MLFQFYCPQGHLLEGAQTQAGQQGQCPICGSAFVIPAMTAPAPVETPLVVTPGFVQQMPQVAPQFENVGQAIAAAAMAAAAQVNPPIGPPLEGPIGPPANVTVEPEEPTIYRIPCPSGHELQTPVDMLGQQAMCPYCNQQFELRREDSVEYKAHEAELRRRRDERLNKFWYTWSIRAAILVGLLLAGMLIYLVFGRTPT